MPRVARDPINDPEEILLKCGRCYAYRGKYLQIQVFTRYLTEAHTLEKKYGGHYYRHGTGYTWLVGKRQMLLQIIDELQDRFPSENGFEVPIITNYR